MLSVANNIIMVSVVMLNIVMQNVVMLNVVMLNVVMLSVVMLSVVVLNVVLPSVTLVSLRVCTKDIFHKASMPFCQLTLSLKSLCLLFSSRPTVKKIVRPFFIEI